MNHKSLLIYAYLSFGKSLVCIYKIALEATFFFFLLRKHNYYFFKILLERFQSNHQMRAGHN